jgi:translocation and assembly module TamB
MNRLIRIAIRTSIVVAIVLVVGTIATVMILRSAWFHERLRTRVIAEIEKSTGGRVEIGNFDWDWDHLTVTVGPLVLHGTEPAGETPLLKIRSAIIGLHIISMLERKVDLASLRVEQPEVRVVFYPDGKTNLPTPAVRDQKSWAESLINLRVGRYEIVDGVLDYDNRTIPLGFRGEDLKVRMDFDGLRSRYRGELAFRHARVVTGGLNPIQLAIASTFQFDKTRIEIPALRASLERSSGGSHVDVSGVLEDVRSPRGTLKLRSTISVRDALAISKTHVTGLAQSGSTAFEGQLAIALANASRFTLTGQLNAKGLGYNYEQVKIEGADLRASLNANVDKVSLSRVALHSGGATATGAAELTKSGEFKFDGNFEGLTVAEAARMAGDQERVPWTGNVGGTLSIATTIGRNDAKVNSALNITPIADEASPIRGSGEFAYDQASNTIRIDNAHAATAATTVDASGVLGATLNVHARSTNLDEILPALKMIDANAPKEMPLKLNHGRVEFQGTVAGAIADPHVHGQISMSNGVIQGHTIDKLSADLDTTKSEVHLDHLTLVHGATQVDGSGSAVARNGSFDDAAISAQLNVRNASISDVAKEWKIDTSASGIANATVRLSGTVKTPIAELTAQVENPAGFGEKLDSLRANVRYANNRIEVSAGEASAFGGTLRFEGAFDHRVDDFKNGTVRFQVTAQNVTITRVQHAGEAAPGVEGNVSGQATGSVRLVNNEFVLDSINGNVAGRSLIYDKTPLGDVTLTAETRGADLAMHGNGKIRDLTVDAQGSWKLSGDMPGTATVRFSRANVATLQAAVMAGGPPGDTELPFDGFIDGASAAVTLSLRKPRDFRAELTVDQLQLLPKSTQDLRLGVQPPDLVVKNSKPVVVDITSDEARIRSAAFSARDTSLEVTGAVGLRNVDSAGLAVRGSINLIVLQLLNPDLAARGNATVQASIRGSLRDPQLSGRMELKNASLYLGDLPNGVDNANGVMIFDRNRATIEKLTAETGGGTVSLTGFLGFGSPLVYRLQAVAEKVRVRYPEDVSVTLNATIALNGTSDASTVSGVVTMTRAAFTPHADFAQVLAQAARPVSAPVAASGYIRGMQFDVHIESGPNFEFQTSLARNLEAEVDLRLRGTPLRPVLLGSVAVNQGEVQMFGNKYTVNRGDIRFANQVKVDPIFDMDLETKARSVTVNITISGTTQKLNINYSSDPPMQPRDIIALLAVGRTPADTAGLNATPATASSTSLNEAGGSLIGQAISAQLSSRLQRFFGASRVKIDPTLSGFEYLPQARLTIEQQVSNDITLTYITNLNRTQEQIVQIEWDFSKQWSAVAVREASGLFGVDFFYRKRIK